MCNCLIVRVTEMTSEKFKDSASHPRALLNFLNDMGHYINRFCNPVIAYKMQKKSGCAYLLNGKMNC